MNENPFVSYAPNGEDVVLWRALRNIDRGRYVAVGANHPTVDSVSRAFYDRGWRGVVCEAVSELAEQFRRERPGDVVVEAPARRLDDVLEEQGWSTDDDIHFLLIDTEGTERNVLESVDLSRWRPWVLVVGATEPKSRVPTHLLWEGLLEEAGYDFCLFDGVSRFYVAHEHAQTLRPLLSYPACILDEYRSLPQQRLQEQVEELTRTRDQLMSDLLTWRGEALERWTEGVSSNMPEVEHLRSEVHRLTTELGEIHQTVSWRVTRPLRAVRTLLGRRAGLR